MLPGNDVQVHQKDPCCRAVCLLLAQIVYVAPMKALAAEVTANFGKRLAALGLVVKELTGVRLGLRSRIQQQPLCWAVLCCARPPVEQCVMRTLLSTGDRLTASLLHQLQSAHISVCGACMRVRLPCLLGRADLMLEISLFPQLT
jgi:hypothetical protein